MEVDTGTTGKILIRGTNWIGDSIISIPAMREIRRIFPRAHICLLVRPWVREIFSSAEYVDEIFEYDKDGIHHGWAGLYRLVSDLKGRGFETAILLQNAFEAALIPWLARIPNRIGYARDGRGLLLTDACKIDPALRSVHQAHYYLGILSAVGWLEPRLWERRNYPLPIKITVRETDRTVGSEMLHGFGIDEQEMIIGVNPGAFYGAAKRWFPDRYASVADALARQYRARIVIFGSQNDLRVAGDVAGHMKNAPVILTGKTTLGQLMALIQRCRLFITNDSGPMHLAAALDVPQVAIFGSTSEIATGPLSGNAVVVKNPVDCSPCFRRECPTDFRCMKEVTVTQVLDASRKILDFENRGRT